MSGKNQNSPENGKQIGDSSDARLDALLESLLREPSLPEPPQWFAARTLARLRNDLRARPLSIGFQLWLERWVFPRLAPRPVLALVFSLAVLLSLAGFHLKAQRDNQQLTFDALALAAQGEAPFNDEESTWPDGAF